ncbi:MAG: thiamine monophosphate synthase [Acidobacteriaceae bacterium]|nr:thiamine monophosphate synthase [Acidobacteriaceae bacterium]
MGLSPVSFPKLYVIADAEVLTRRGEDLRSFALELREAGVGLLQWRNKAGSPQDVLAGAATLREVFKGSGCRLMMNDRADFAVLADFGGVHVGQGDLLPEDARLVVGSDRWIGVSTHRDEQVRLADLSSADYVAVGPVFATGTKLDAEPVVGLEGIRQARSLTTKPIVAIGGITRQNARSVLDAGADSVAIISGLFAPGETVRKVAEDFLRILG